MFSHVGVLFNKPPGTAGLSFTSHPTTSTTGYTPRNGECKLCLNNRANDDLCTGNALKSAQNHLDFDDKRVFIGFIELNQPQTRKGGISMILSSFQLTTYPILIPFLVTKMAETKRQG